MGESPPASCSNNKQFVFIKWREAWCCDVTLADSAHYVWCVQLLPRTDLPSYLFNINYLHLQCANSHKQFRRKELLYHLHTATLWNLKLNLQFLHHRKHTASPWKIQAGLNNRGCSLLGSRGVCVTHGQFRRSAVSSDLECTWKGAVVATSARVAPTTEGKCGDTPSG